MNSDRAEVTLSITAAVRCDGKADRFQCLYRPLLFVIGMDIPLVGQSINGIQFRLCHGFCGRVLNKPAVAMFLCERLSMDRVAIFIKCPEHGNKGLFVVTDRLKGGQFHRTFGNILCLISQPADFFHRQPFRQGKGKLQHRLFSHAIDQVISLRVKKDRPADLVIPEIIVCHSAQRGFDAAQHNGFGILEIAADQVGVNHAGTVRTSVIDAAGRIVITFARFFGRGIIGHHGIHRSGGDTPEQFRFPKTCDIHR